MYNTMCTKYTLTCAEMPYFQEKHEVLDLHIRDFEGILGPVRLEEVPENRRANGKDELVSLDSLPILPDKEGQVTLSPRLEIVSESLGVCLGALGEFGFKVNPI